MTSKTALQDDLVDLLMDQHMQIRDLFAEVEFSSGDDRKNAFTRLVRLLAVHETAEEQLVHPLARQAIEGGDSIVDERLDEERQAKEMLSELEQLDQGSTDFDTGLARLRLAVLAHANAEEAHEFRYLRRTVEPARLQALAAAVIAAEATAPTHPHPGVESAKANLTVGLVVSAFDRAKDLVNKVRP